MMAAFVSKTNVYIEIEVKGDRPRLRIDNSWKGVFCVVAVFSVPMHFIFTHYISNERESISLFNNMNNYTFKVIPEKW